MNMNIIKSNREEYRAPLAEWCEALPCMLCQSDPDDWGNEPLIPGQPLN